MIKQRHLKTAVIALIAIFFIWGSYSLLQRQRVPRIPKVIRGEEGAEPRLKVYMHDSGTIQEMSFEEYIAGVVAAEMDPTWHTEALAAQAIIARSFTLQKIAEKGGVPKRNAHASTDIEEFQAYNAGKINDNVRRAVEQTRGKVLTYRGRFIRGWFHAYAGPRSALATEGLEYKKGNPPYIQIVESPAGEIVPEEEASWSASFPLEEVRQKVVKLTGADPGPLNEVRISKKGPSGRATRLTFNDQVKVSAPSLRLELGSTVMRSTFIKSLEIGNGSLNLTGVGYGHGVGMCQWGARALAEDGMTGEEIPGYFYRNVELVQIWN